MQPPSTLFQPRMKRLNHDPSVAALHIGKSVNCSTYHAASIRLIRSGSHDRCRCFTTAWAPTPTSVQRNRIQQHLKTCSQVSRTIPFNHTARGQPCVAHQAAIVDQGISRNLIQLGWWLSWWWAPYHWTWLLRESVIPMLLAQSHSSREFIE